MSEQQSYSSAGVLQGVTNSPFLSEAGADTPPAAAPPQSHTPWKKELLGTSEARHSRILISILKIKTLEAPCVTVPLQR